MRLKEGIKSIINCKEDSVVIYPLNKYNLANKEYIGRQKFKKRFIV